MSIVLRDHVHPATVIFVSFETVVYLNWPSAHLAPSGIAIDARDEGRAWCRGHWGSAVDALRTVHALGGSRPAAISIY